MKEYLIEISLDKQKEVNTAITHLLKSGLSLDKTFSPRKLNITTENDRSFKNNYLIKGYLRTGNAQNLLRNCTVTNLWQSKGNIPF